MGKQGFAFAPFDDGKHDTYDGESPKNDDHPFHDKHMGGRYLFLNDFSFKRITLPPSQSSFHASRQIVS